MDQLIDIIFENPFFIVLIIGGLFSLFKGKEDQSKEKQEEHQRQQRQQQRQRQQRQRQQQAEQRFPQKEQQTATKQAKDNYKEPVSHSSVEDQWQQQMQQFADHLNINEQNEDDHSGMTDKVKVADMKRETEVQNLVSKYNHKKFKKEFSSSLTSKGLINSIVMAEVLGEPRAKKPYQSVLNKRN